MKHTYVVALDNEKRASDNRKQSFNNNKTRRYIRHNLYMQILTPAKSRMVVSYNPACINPRSFAYILRRR